MKEKIIPLAHLREGQGGTVVYMTLQGAIRRRVRELGLLPEAQVTCLRIAPSGSPAAYLICGAVVALRSRDAEQVMVLPWEE